MARGGEAMHVQEEAARHNDVRLTWTRNNQLESLKQMDQASTDACRVLECRRSDHVALRTDEPLATHVDKIIKTVNGVDGAVTGFNQCIKTI